MGEPAEDISLFQHADMKIEKVKKELEKLMVQDLNLSHKMDLVVTEQKLLKERVEMGVSQTVSKTYNLVQDIQKKFEANAADNVRRDDKIRRVEKLVDWFYRGLIFAFVAGLLVIALNADKWIH